MGKESDSGGFLRPLVGTFLFIYGHVLDALGKMMLQIFPPFFLGIRYAIWVVLESGAI